MAGFKNLNTENPALLRPYKLADLQYLWEAISLIVGTRGNQNTPTIVWGFENGADGKLTNGVIAYNGELFYYDGSDSLNYPSPISINIALVKKEESQRVFSDKTVQPFYYNNVVIKADTEAQGDVVVATFNYVTDFSLRNWKANFGVANSIRSEMFSFACVTSNALAEGSVTTQKIAEDAITSDKIMAGAVDNSELADAAVDSSKIDYHAISEQNLDDSIVSNRTIQADAVTPDKCSESPFVRSGVTVLTGSNTINDTGLYIVNLQASTTTITFGAGVSGVVHVIARNTGSQAITLTLQGATAVATYGTISVPANSQYALTVRITTGSPVAVIEGNKLDFFQTFPLLG